MIQSTDNGVDFEMDEITPIKEKTRYFHTDVIGSVVMPKGFHAWLFVGTQTSYDAFIDEIMKDESCGKVVGVHSYNTYEEWNKHWGRPVGNKNKKDIFDFI